MTPRFPIIPLTDENVRSFPENPTWDSQASLLKDYFSLSDAALRSRHAPEQGRFIAETTLIVERALAAGFRPRSVLCLDSEAESIRALLEEAPPGAAASGAPAAPSGHDDVVPVFTGPPAVLERLTGFHLHRGALASMYRKPQPALGELLAEARRIVVLEDLVDHTNLGAIIRSAVALGGDGIVLSPGCADPLYRRAIRTSMGASLTAPIVRVRDWEQICEELHSSGFATVALALTEGAERLQDFSESLGEGQKTALFLGSEGPGLSREILDQVRHHVIIPMHRGTDSLNVAQAATVALWELGRDCG